jgi:hypothetical protein
VAAGLWCDAERRGADLVEGKWVRREQGDEVEDLVTLPDACSVAWDSKGLTARPRSILIAKHSQFDESRFVMLTSFELQP